MKNFFQKIHIAILILCIFLPFNSFSKAIVKKVIFDKNHNIEISVTQKIKYKTYSLKNPDRIVVDLYEVDYDKIIFNKKPPFVKKVRYAKQKGFLRLVFDLKQKTFIQSAKFQKLKNDKNHKIIIRIAPEISYVLGSISNENKSKTKNKPKKIPTIVIDAGHGGKDPGTIGLYLRSKEKNITLSYARELAKQLQRSKKYKVYLTRNSDVFIPLKGRVMKARKVKADLFISLHANAAKNRRAKGFSIYTLSEKASDKQAARLARKENRADIISGINFKNASSDILKTLIDLSQRSSMNYSSRFANIAIKKVKQENIDILHNTHRFAGFVVLTAPDMVSILIELGYLSNKSEEKKLNSLTHKRKIVKGLVNAIDEYFKFKK